MPPSLMILAAGVGSRFGGEKQRTAFGPQNQTLPEYAILHAMQAGFGKFILIIRQGMKEEWADFLKPKLAALGIANVQCVLVEQTWPEPIYNRTKPWGTAHAISCGAKNVDGPFMVVNGDDYYGPQAYITMATALGENEPNTGYIVPYALNETLSPNGTVTRAICQVDANGYLSGIKETYNLQQPLGENENKLVSMNCWGFSGDVAPKFEALFRGFIKSHPQPADEFVLPEAVSALMKRYNFQVKVLPRASGWFGVTYAADTELVKQKLRQT